MKIPFRSSCLALGLVSALVSCKPQAAPKITPQPEAGSPAVDASSGTRAPRTASNGAPGQQGGPGGQGGQGRRGGGGGDSAEQMQQRLDRMKESLALTDDQSQKIKAIYEEQRPAMEALQGLNQEDRMAKMRELREASTAKINAILTPEQQGKWEEQRKQRQAEREARRGQGGGGQGGGRGQGGGGQGGNGNPPPPQ